MLKLGRAIDWPGVFFLLYWMGGSVSSWLVGHTVHPPFLPLTAGDLIFVAQSGITLYHHSLQYILGKPVVIVYAFALLDMGSIMEQNCL